VITITIKTDSDAFRSAGDTKEPSEGPEVARILRKLADEVAPVKSLWHYSAALVDLHGLTVGRIEVD